MEQITSQRRRNPHDSGENMTLVNEVPNRPPEAVIEAYRLASVPRAPVKSVVTYNR